MAVGVGHAAESHTCDALTVTRGGVGRAVADVQAYGITPRRHSIAAIGADIDLVVVVDGEVGYHCGDVGRLNGVEHSIVLTQFDDIASDIIVGSPSHCGGKTIGCHRNASDGLTGQCSGECGVVSSGDVVITAACCNAKSVFSAVVETSNSVSQATNVGSDDLFGGHIVNNVCGSSVVALVGSPCEGCAFCGDVADLNRSRFEAGGSLTDSQADTVFRCGATSGCARSASRVSVFAIALLIYSLVSVSGKGTERSVANVAARVVVNYKHYIVRSVIDEWFVEDYGGPIVVGKSDGAVKNNIVSCDGDPVGIALKLGLVGADHVDDNVLFGRCSARLEEVDACDCAGFTKLSSGVNLLSQTIFVIVVQRQVVVGSLAGTYADQAFGANLEGGEADGGDGCFSFATDSLNADCVLGVGGQVSEGECEAGGGTEHRIVGHIIYGIVVGVAVPGDGGTVGGDIGGYKVGSRSAAGQCGEGCADSERGVALAAVGSHGYIIAGLGFEVFERVGCAVNHIPVSVAKAHKPR